MYADCTMQNPEDCAIQEELANVEDLVQQPWVILTLPNSILTHSLAPTKLWQTMLGHWRSSAFLVRFHLQSCLKQLQESANDWLLYLVCVLSPNDLHLLNQVASTYTCVPYLLHTLMNL